MKFEHRTLTCLEYGGERPIGGLICDRCNRIYAAVVTLTGLDFPTVPETGLCFCDARLMPGDAKEEFTARAVCRDCVAAELGKLISS